MARREGVSLVDLSDADMNAIDLAMAHYREAVHRADVFLPTQAIGESVVNIQRLVLEMKRGD